MKELDQEYETIGGSLDNSFEMDYGDEYNKAKARGLTSNKKSPEKKKKAVEKEVRTLTFVDMSNLSYLARSVGHSNEFDPKKRKTNRAPVTNMIIEEEDANSSGDEDGTKNIIDT